MTFLGLFASLVIALAGSAGDNPSPDPAPIRVISSTYEIDFPDQIVFRLEAEANTRISEVTLFYILGQQKVRIYGYPEFEPAHRITADFRIRTSGASYIPNGADIRYHYVIRDAEGNTFESERFELEYKDPAYDWQRFQEGDLVILWHDRSRDAVARVAADVNRRLASVKELLGLDTVSPMKAVILNNRREAGRSFPFVSEAARQAHLYGGFAFGELDLFVLVGLDRDGMVHEMTHLLLDEAMDSPLGTIPAWLNEGLATYFESGSRGRESTLSRAASQNRLLPLRSMGRVPGRPRDVSVFYAQSWSLVTYMIDTRGQESMSALLEAINDGKRVDAAIPEAYGISLEELEREWRAQLSGEYSRVATVDPGTAGTSAIIAGAVAVAVVALIVRWLRHLANPPSAEDPGA